MPSLLPARRIYFHLPVNTARERRAAAQVAGFTRSVFGGATQTSFQPPVLRGYWLEGGILYVDEIALLIADADEATMAREELEDTLSRLRAGAVEAYRDAGSPQLEFWIIMEATQRVSGDEAQNSDSH